MMTQIKENLPNEKGSKIIKQKKKKNDPRGHRKCREQEKKKRMKEN